MNDLSSNLRHGSTTESERMNWPETTSSRFVFHLEYWGGSIGYFSCLIIFEFLNTRCFIYLIEGGCKRNGAANENRSSSR